MAKGKIGVTSENLFPIIKKFLYSDHDIFLREIVSNAVDATQKLKVLAAKGEYKGDMSSASVRVTLDPEAKTLTVSDSGIGMTADEVKRYINQIAFSGANEFLEKYKDDVNAIIGHFGLGFYSSFMVSDKVEILTRSWQEDAQAVRWSCKGNPEYTLTDAEKDTVGTDIIMHINSESEEFLEDSKITELLEKYCKFLPVPIVFGKKKTWKDGKEVETDEDNQINETQPAWTQKPADLKDDDYLSFYRKLYPMADDPLFNIHLNVDYPFNLTGILYFPKIKNNLEVQKNKIQLYSNQVFVTDSVEGIVPEFLTLLHGVLDSPDIPLNVSRSYLQADSNVKKISSHISKKVSDRLGQLFKDSRSDFEKKWDDLKIFIEYGMLTDEKFYERSEGFLLLKNTDSKYFTIEEYDALVKEHQTDKDNNLIYLYTNHPDEQFTFVEAAKSKGYDVLIMDDVLTTPLINKLEQKYSGKRFVRVDSDVADHLIRKSDSDGSDLSFEEKQKITPLFEAVVPQNGGVNYMVDLKSLGENSAPMVITRSEWMRRMKDMSQFQGGMNFYGDLPESLNLVVNTDHPLVKKVLDQKDQALGDTLQTLSNELESVQSDIAKLQADQKEMKADEVPSADKERLEALQKQVAEMEESRRKSLADFGGQNPLARQMVDLALLANGLLKGADLDRFVKRSVELIQ